MAKKTNCTINGNKYWRQYATISGKRRMIYGESETDWKKKVDAEKALAEKGIIANKSTLGESIRIWMYNILPADTKTRNKVSYAVYEGIYRNQLKTDLAKDLMGTRINEVKTNHVQVFLNSMGENGDSESKMESAKKVLNLFFSYAVDEGYLLKNPCKRSHVPKINAGEGGSVLIDEDGEVIEVFSDEEMLKIKNVLSNKRDRFLVILGFATAMREGEMFALRYKDFKSNPLYISKSQKTIRHIKQGEPIEYEIIDGAPKSKSGYRYMPMADWLLEEFEIHKKMRQIEMVSWGKGRIKENDLVFLSPTGLRCQAAQIQKSWKEILFEAGVDYKKFHALRHTCITKWVQAPGANIVAVKELAGHKKLETTLRYTHIEVSNKTDLVNSSVTNAIFG